MTLEGKHKIRSCSCAHWTLHCLLCTNMHTITADCKSGGGAKGSEHGAVNGCGRRRKLNGHTISTSVEMDHALKVVSAVATLLSAVRGANALCQ